MRFNVGRVLNKQALDRDRNITYNECERSYTRRTDEDGD